MNGEAVPSRQSRHRRRGRSSRSTPRRYEPGRACSTCQKILSVWNRGPTCYACDQARLESYPDTPLIELLEEIP